MSKKYVKLNQPVSLGCCYRNGMSWYKVLEQHSNGNMVLCRPTDGWTLVAHGAALWETDSGMQLLWDWSTHGRFEPRNKEVAS